MNIVQHLIRWGRTHPDAPAVAAGARRLRTYGELSDRAARIAGHLAAGLGLAPGARVGVLMKNVPEYVEALYGIWHAGLVAVPINAKLHPREIAYILDNAGAAVCLATPELAAGLADGAERPAGLAHVIETGGPAYAGMVAAAPAPPVDRAPDDGAWLFYTSGTTGRPKGVVITHRNLLAMALSYLADVDAIDPGDCIVHAAPMSHGSGIYAVPHVMCGALNVVPESGGFDPAEVVDLLGHHRGVTIFAAPTMVRRLLDHLGGRPPRNLDGLKTVVYGGGPMYVADLKEALDVLGNRLVQIYGQGESPMTITCLGRRDHADRGHPRWEARLASAGLPHSVVEVRIVDGDDRPLPPGETGEIVVRGETVMRGYWRNDAATAETLRGGWLHTGDVGTMDEDGYVYLKDRSKDLIISGGANIYPREVEEVLLRHPAVAEASVIGRPHPEWGEEVVAFVVPAPGREPSAPALDAFCLEHIARFKRPRVYRFVDSLPKNNYGKVLKTELRARLARETADREGEDVHG